MNPHSRNIDLSLLHPLFAIKLEKMLGKLDAENIPFKVFEAFRYPERQADLYAQGRTLPGHIVTKAKPWQSYHQYGLAVDLVLFVNGKWSWNDTGAAEKVWWKHMEKLAKEYELTQLSFERPHVQYGAASYSTLFNGAYPKGGDGSLWAEHLHDTILQWKKTHTTDVPLLPTGVPKRPTIV